MFHFIQTHGADALMVGWVLSAAISSMPQPDTQSGKLYTWFYHFTHVAAANLQQYFRRPLPPA